jgi:hypothetical protein
MLGRAGRALSRQRMVNLMGLDLLPMLPCALPSGSAVAIVGQRARPQQDCQNGLFFLLIPCL